jgi:sialate O-acetylesterase
MQNPGFLKFVLMLWLGLAPLSYLSAALQVPHVFGDNMVIQRDRPIRVWGTADPGASVRVRFADRDRTVQAGDDGAWEVVLDPLPASTLGRSFSVFSGDESVEYDGVLVGDVWVLGGQSNMEDVLEDIYYGDVEVISAHHPLIRLMTVPQSAGPEPFPDMERLNEFNSWTGRYEQKGSWFQCTPAAVHRFSAIGYIFGRRLHLVTGVPIGLIDASWGGTTVEAWTSRESLMGIPEARGLIEEWDEKVAAYDAEASLKARIEQWEQDTERRKAAGQPPNPRPTEPAPDPALDRNNPGAAFNGMIMPMSRFGIKGAIFNQGYNNALGDSRPRLYAKVLKRMIEDWRNAFHDDALPFGIVALTAGGEPQTLENYEIRMVDPAPFIREAQARVWQEMEHVGFAPAYDEQVPWYHPHKKLVLGERIARWALNTQYGQGQIGWEPAVCTAWSRDGDAIVLTFDRAVRVHDGRPFEGFAIAGTDQRFFPAEAEFVVTGQNDRGRDQLDESMLRVHCALVKEPVAVRYAWARNPLGNAVNSQHHERIIPIVSFRTDDWDWPEAPFRADGPEAEREHREKLAEMRRLANEWAKERSVMEAEEVIRKIKGE